MFFEGIRMRLKHKNEENELVNAYSNGGAIYSTAYVVDNSSTFES